MGQHPRQGPHSHQPEPIRSILLRLNDEQEDFRRHSAHRKQRKQQKQIDLGKQQQQQQQQQRWRPRSAALLSKTPLASAWPEHQPRPRSAVARARVERHAARGDISGGRISTSELRAGAREQREEHAQRREWLLQYDKVGCVWRELRAIKSFSSTPAPAWFDCPPPDHGRCTKTASRVAELLCQPVVEWVAGSTTVAACGANGTASNAHTRVGPRAGPEAVVLRTSLYEESMALTWRPTGRACWQDRAPAAATVVAAPTVSVTTQGRHQQRKRKGGRAALRGQSWQPRTMKANSGPVKPRQGRTDGPRGREAILFRHN